MDDSRSRVGLTAGPVRPEIDVDAAGKITGLEPKIAAIENALTNGNTGLADSTALPIVVSQIDAQGMLRMGLDKLHACRIKNRVVPAEMKDRVIISIIGIAIPIAGQAVG